MIPSLPRFPLPQYSIHTHTHIIGTYLRFAALFCPTHITHTHPLSVHTPSSQNDPSPSFADTGSGTDARPPPADREIFRIRDEISAHATDASATFYDILGVPPSASQDDITKAYRAQSRSLHPDKVKQKLKSDHKKREKAAEAAAAAGNGGTKPKAPTSSEIRAAVKAAEEAQTRLSLIANILKGPERDRYDHFLRNGFPLWKGTDYYYNRYRPGLGTAIVGVVAFCGGAVHYLILYMNWKRHTEFIDRYIRFARDTAWGGTLNVPEVDAAAPAPAPAEEPEDDNNNNVPPQPMNRKERRFQEKQARKEDGRPASKKAARKAPAQSSSSSRSASATPTGVRKRVVAENGKILVVDSVGDVYLEEEDEEGNVGEYLLDVSFPHLS